MRSRPSARVQACFGRAGLAIVGQVWLTGAPINRVSDTTPILHVEGTADQGGSTVPFTGTVTIGANRVSGNAAQAGASPICKERIVSPIATSITLEKGGYLALQVDPRFLFVNVDFSLLPAAGDHFAFVDAASATDQPSRNLYNNLHAARPELYAFAWVK